jgi:hypothetical protein
MCSWAPDHNPIAFMDRLAEFNPDDGDMLTSAGMVQLIRDAKKFKEDGEKVREYLRNLDTERYEREHADTGEPENRRRNEND